jgi:hypothetical protein
MFRLVKIAVSASLIGVLVWKADWRSLAANIGDLDSLVFTLALAALVLQYPLSAWKWQFSLRMHSIEYSYWYLLRVLCIAFFFNNFLPTAIGGDAYRAYRTTQRARRKVLALSAVLVERLVGLLALLFLGYLCAIYLVVNGDVEHEGWLVVILVAASGGMMLLALLWKIGFLAKAIDRLTAIPKLEPLRNSLQTVFNNRQHSAGLVGVSILSQATAIVAIWLLFAALGTQGAFAQSGFTAAAAGVAGILPVSINGIGVVEGSFVAAAWESGLPADKAIVVALFLRAFMLASSVVFGLIYAAEPRGERLVAPESPS